MQPNGAAPKNVLFGILSAALNKLNNFILLDRLRTVGNKFAKIIDCRQGSFKQRNPNLYRSESTFLCFTNHLNQTNLDFSPCTRDTPLF